MISFLGTERAGLRVEAFATIIVVKKRRCLSCNEHLLYILTDLLLIEAKTRSWHSKFAQFNNALG